MNKRSNLVLHIMGLTLAFCGAGLLLSALVEIVAGDTKDWVWLGLLGIVGAGIGSFLWRFTEVPRRTPVVDVFASVTVSWLTMAVIGMIAYLATGTLTTLDQAMFESMSGFTTTGATVLQPSPTDATRFDASAGMIFWRSMTQWLGGMGVIVLVVAVLPTAGSMGMGLLQAEAPGPTGERLTPRVRSTARRLWGVYLLFTLVLILAYTAAGMTFLDAINHSLTTVSTGGFSSYTLSLGHFQSALIEWIAIFAMFTVGSSFTLLYRLLRGKPGPLLRSVEFRVYTLVVLIATIVVFLALGPEYRNAEGFRGAMFSIVAVVTTTGYGTVDYGQWNDAAQAVILVLLPVGAMAGSTAGGVKLVRVLAVASFAHRETLKKLHPGLVRPVRVGHTLVTDPVALQVLGFIALALAAFGAGGLLIALSGVDSLTAFSASATTFGNVGPGLGEIGPRSDFMAITSFGRMVSVVNMLLGRLEIYPLLLALTKLSFPGLRPTFARMTRQPKQARQPNSANKIFR